MPRRRAAVAGVSSSRLRRMNCQIAAGTRGAGIASRLGTRAGAIVSADARATARGPVAVDPPPGSVSGRQDQPPGSEGQIERGVRGKRV